MSELGATEIPASAVVHASDEVKSRDGKSVWKVRTIDVDGLMSVVNVLQKHDILGGIMGGLNYRNLLDARQLAEVDAIGDKSKKAEIVKQLMGSLGPEKRVLLAQATQRKIEAFFKIPEVAKAVVQACSNVEWENVGKLHPVDLINLLKAIVKINDIREMIEVGAGFFTDLGGLTGLAVEKVSQAQGDE
jgi:hypothetical protein